MQVYLLVVWGYEAGRYEAVWDAEKNSSGVYLYRLITDEFTESKKMILLK